MSMPSCSAPETVKLLSWLSAEQLGIDIDVADLMDVCLAENDRRLGKYDARLVRPNFVPRMVRLARRTLLKPAKKAAAAA